MPEEPQQRINQRIALAVIQIAARAKPAESLQRLARRLDFLVDASGLSAEQVNTAIEEARRPESRVVRLGPDPEAARLQRLGDERAARRCAAESAMERRNTNPVRYGTFIDRLT